MMTLIIGTPDCGKSARAEELALQTGDEIRYYLATMKVMDEAGSRRVAKHRALREGKGFVTIERERDLAGLACELKDAERSTVLLECVSNLVGNMMHDEPRWEAERFAEAVVSDIVQLAEKVRHLIVVTNTYEDDGSGYDDDTRLYVKLLNGVNDRLTEMADRVIDLR